MTQGEVLDLLDLSQDERESFFDNNAQKIDFHKLKKSVSSLKQKADHRGKTDIYKELCDFQALADSRNPELV